VLLAVDCVERINPSELDHIQRRERSLGDRT